ncbi:MAG: transcription termination/antitermination protein NusA [Lachnospiraceae bacterium]|nr:transcription termination/antitermination protein NusA [Lachnospiraceae bacterium]
MAGNKEFIDALDAIEKERNISKDVMIEAIETSLLQACKNQFGKSENIKVQINRNTGTIGVFAEKTIVEEVEDPVTQITLDEAAQKFPRKKLAVGDSVNIEVTPKNFDRISAQKAKQTVIQKVREEERKVLYDQYSELAHQVVTGVVQRYIGKNISINLGKVDAILTEADQMPGEHFRARGDERIKLYVTEVKDSTKGPRISVSRTHKDLLRRLFEAEVAEIADGTVQIHGIVREPGSRSKMSVSSNDPNVDARGACIGNNSERVNAIVNELNGEKIDIVYWSEDPKEYIEQALSPAKVSSVEVDEFEKTAKVIVPDFQLSLAIGKEGQNVRLAAKLTGYKIDIRSESQVREGDEF